jgi:hypothetical protein
VVERRLRIDHLVVRMRGVAEPQARELVAALGEAVLRRLNDSSAIGSQLPGVRHIERIDAGSVALTCRDRLARHLADSVMAHLPPAKGDR